MIEETVKLLLTFVKRIAVVEGEIKHRIFVVEEIDFDDPHFNKIVGIEVTGLISKTKDKEVFLREVAKEEPTTIKMTKEVRLFDYQK